MKKYIRRIHCLCNERMDSCLIDQWEEIKEHQKWIEFRISETDQYYRKVRQDCLNFETVDDVLNYHIDYEVEEFLRTEMSNLRATCELEPSSCYKVVEHEQYVLFNKKNEMDVLLDKVSTHHKLIGDLKERFEDNSNLVLNFKEDKDGEITCTYFNVDEFNITGGSYLYLSHREVINPRSNINFSIKDGGLHIVFVTSHKEGKNHGSFMLSLLLDLVPVFNKKIEEYNLQSFNELKHLTWEQFRKSRLYKEKVNHIYGTIGSPGISELEKLRLIDFYKRNDLHKDGAIYREI
ncbi:hypothetical protein HP548_12395 [Paenibacillus taichungensis]|uniref:Uncharacterized protein n=1 Tax=Paenibacillus taichungensis TaxID=484184 RepID=A0ABX2MLE0_9BACL|nr:hypothetical protein [Paenibacillus taichungensis]NUU54876.1 hypothetical protein [Paenibacillus taichungensis]